MKKDTVIAIIIGIIIGGLIAVGVIYFPNFISRVFRSSNQTNQLLTPTPPVNVATTILSLDITEPANNSVLFTRQTTVKGKIQPSGPKIIIVDTNNESLLTKSSGNGEFSQDVSLVEGINPLSISVYDESGNRETKTLTLFYTPEKL
ncbi:hypothetical protein HY338_00765 [Candidatus Gottesmanbacteria bacterium]|nr:hypothetical protein [Candidatus Gottesmanbacteria bacterium]